MIRYRYNSLLDRFKRKIGVSDGYLICNDCEKPFFNLSPSEVCEGCWAFFNESDYNGSL